MRHITRHLWLYVLLGLILTLVAALVGSLPLVASQLAADSLQRSLAKLHPSAKHMLLTGDEIPEEINGRLATPLGSLYQDTFPMRDTVIFGQPFVQRGERLDLYDPTLFDTLFYHLHSFDTLEEHTILLAGAYPEPQTEVGTPRQVVIGQQTADWLSLSIGDVVVQRDADISFAVVGLVAPANPSDPRWWGDERQLAFGVWERVSYQPEFTDITASIILHPDDMAATYPGNVSWRVILNGDQINASNATAIGDRIRNLEATLTPQQVNLDTQLLTLLNQFRDDNASSQITLILLATQALLAIFYTLYIVGQLVLEQTSGEIATLAARGFSVSKIRLQFGLRYGVIAFVMALPLGLLLAATLIWQFPIAPAGRQPWSIPTISWLLAVIALLIGWLILTLPVGRAVRHSLTPQHQLAAPDSFNTNGLLFDLAVLSLGLLSFWQLRQFASVALAETETITIDPLLLLGPTLLFLGAALLLRHLAPLLIQLLARLGSQSPSALFPTALAWLARERTRSGRLILLVAFASGLAIFAAIFTRSVTERQLEMARYRSGADLQLGVKGAALARVQEVLAADGRVGTMTAVFRGTAVPHGGNQVSLLAVDINPTTAIYDFPDGISDNDVVSLMSLLENPAPDAVPVLVSRTYVVPGTAVGDRAVMQFGREPVAIEIRGIVDAFPTLQVPFMVANFDALRPQIDGQPSALLLDNQYELWVSLTEPVTAHALLTDAGLAEEIVVLGETAVLHDDIRFHLLSQQIVGMFRFNVIVLIILSFASLLLLQLLDGWRRLPSLGAMLSLGISRRGLMRLLVWEGFILTVVSLLVGAGLGFGLVRLTLPLLSLTLSSSLGTATAAPLIYNWGELGQLVVLIFALYLIGISIPALIIGRIDAARLLRLEDG